jgi:hypothetical protein
MIAENPSPDNDTMETLIETNEQLSKAMSQHQRAVLNARKVMGMGNGEVGNTPPGPPPPRTDSGFAAPPGPPPSQSNPAPTERKAVKNQPPIPPPGDYAPTDDGDEDPFADPSARKSQNPPLPQDRPPVATGQFNDRLGIEPYHPGFQETPSYMGRQDSSVGNITMHAGGAIGENYERRAVDFPAPTGGYEAEADSKAPVYRY